jgi:hypothetical protein
MMADIRALVRDHGEAACALLDQITPTDPDVNRKLSEVARHVVLLRDELILAQRAGDDCREPLGRVNASISAMFGLEFPSSGLQWARVSETRDGLRRLLDDVRAPPTRREAVRPDRRKPPPLKPV